MYKYATWIVTGVLVIAGATTAGLVLSNKSTDNGSTANVSSSSQNLPTLSTNEPLQTQQRITQQDCLADTCLRVPNMTYPASTLPSDIQTDLAKAMNNEYKLQAYYQAVLSHFGNLRPFAMIIGAEEQHIAVLNSIYQKYGLTPQTNQWSNKTFSLSTFSSACQTAASYEQETINLYNGLLPQVSNYPDIYQVFTSLRDASQNSHLPAFNQCS